MGANVIEITHLMLSISVLLESGQEIVASYTISPLPNLQQNAAKNVNGATPEYLPGPLDG